MNELELLANRLENEKNVEDIMICAIEEMSEVTKILTKYLRKSEKFSVEQLTEEIAHALLMLNTVKNIFNIEDSQINEHKLMALKKCFNVK